MSCGRVYIEAGLTLPLEIRLTAFELQSLKIPSTMLCDSMVGSLFQHHQIHAIGELDGPALGAHMFTRSYCSCRRGPYRA